MQIKSVFVKELSQQIRVLQAEDKKEIVDELSVLSSPISNLSYRSWVLDTFIVGINQLFSYILEASEGEAEATAEIKDVLYGYVLKLNPLLNPKNIYISPANNLNLTKNGFKLVESPAWEILEDQSNLVALDLNDYHKIIENARNFDHYITVEEWDLLPQMHVAIRQFNKSLKLDLINGYTPKTEDGVKYFVVITCIDNFQSLYKYIEHSGVSIAFDKILNSLYELAIKHNSFLKLKLKEFNRINKNYKFHKEGTENTFSTEERKARKNLSSIQKKDILNLYDNLTSKVFGQDSTIKAVCNSVQKAYNGLKNPKTPIGSFLFYGTTSTGKTELAKALAKLLTNSSNGLVKIACNTLTSSHNLHTLIGAPPGYVGYEEQGLLTRALERNKFKVILFDEIEKAHPKLFDLVLEMMEEGEIMVADGSIVNVSECLIIFTSNIGQQEGVRALDAAGFRSSTFAAKEQDAILAHEFENTLNKTLKPEFRARLTGQFYFPRLSRDSLIKAATTKLNDYIKLLGRRKLKLVFNKNLPEYIYNNCAARNIECHARDIRNFIDMEVMENLGDFILQNNINNRNDVQIEINLESDSIVFNMKELTSQKSTNKKIVKQVKNKRAKT